MWYRTELRNYSDGDLKSVERAVYVEANDVLEAKKNSQIALGIENGTDDPDIEMSIPVRLKTQSGGPGKNAKKEDTYSLFRIRSVKAAKTLREKRKWIKQRTDQPLKTFETGATRVPVQNHSHYICPQMNLRVGQICAEGFAHYPDKQVEYAELSTGRLGLPLANLKKHAQNHWDMFWSGDKSEDHLAKVAWAIQQIMHQETLEGENPCQHFNFLLKENDRRDPLRQDRRGKEDEEELGHSNFRG